MGSAFSKLQTDNSAIDETRDSPSRLHKFGIWWHSKDHESILILTIGLAVVALIMVLPLWLITRLGGDGSFSAAAGAGGAAVGIAAIFRSASRDILRTSFGVAARTAARAISRHWTHLIIQWVARTFNLAEPTARVDGTPHPIAAIVMGYVALAISYGAVLSLVDPASRTVLLGSSPLPVLAAVSACPLLCYYSLAYGAGKALDVRIIPRTEIDGLVLQIYFTAAASYLPLTSEAEYHGPRRKRKYVALIVIGGLFALHLVVGMIGAAFGLELLEHVAVLLLLHAFVFSFPFEPLDGRHIWENSKLMWLGTFLPIALAFHYRIPAAFYEII
ncbi:MAG: hypothetical protein MJE77_11620 [Proteobacteria bacterium]|nr:hypothetical protein [Pseudomonadota bacterium]